MHAAKRTSVGVLCFLKKKNEKKNNRYFSSLFTSLCVSRSYQYLLRSFFCVLLGSTALRGGLLSKIANAWRRYLHTAAEASNVCNRSAQSVFALPLFLCYSRGNQTLALSRMGILPLHQAEGRFFNFRFFVPARVKRRFPCYPSLIQLTPSPSPRPSLPSHPSFSLTSLVLLLIYAVGVSQLSFQCTVRRSSYSGAFTRVFLPPLHFDFSDDFFLFPALRVSLVPSSVPFSSSPPPHFVSLRWLRFSILRTLLRLLSWPSHNLACLFLPTLPEVDNAEAGRIPSNRRRNPMPSGSVFSSPVRSQRAGPCGTGNTLGGRPTTAKASR